MDRFEVEQHETLTRDEAATRLRRIANLLSGSGEEVKFDRGEMKFKVAIPNEIANPIAVSRRTWPRARRRSARR